MIVGVLTIQIHMKGVNSLKEKRSIVKSLIERLKSRFNFSVSQVDKQDNKTCAVIGMAFVSNDTKFINSQLDLAVNFIRRDGRCYVGQIDREIL